MNKKIYGLTMGALALGFMASCSNEVKNEPVTPDSTLPGMELAKAPDLVIWNDAQVFAGEAPANASTKATTKYQNDEVEVNLAIQDIHEKYDIEDLVSHLSIHVRSNTDVKVVLPVEKKWYCDQDDLYIYNERDVNEWTLGESENQLTATVGGKVVTLKVTFNDDNITITTEGIDDDVLAAVTADNGDIIGINFDVYNYFNRANQYTTGSYAAWTLAGMKAALDLSTIEFVQNTVEADDDEEEELEGVAEDVVTYTGPDYYINAFTGDDVTIGQTTVKRDCTVAPVAAQLNWFYNPTKDRYSENMVYVNKRFPGIDDGSQGTGNNAGSQGEGNNAGSQGEGNE